MTPALDLQILRIFLRVSELGSFTQAATVLGITQPTISRAVKELEDAWAANCSTAPGAGITLSEFGKVAQAQARSLLIHADQMADELTSFNRRPTAPFRSGCRIRWCCRSFRSSSRSSASTPRRYASRYSRGSATRSSGGCRPARSRSLFTIATRKARPKTGARSLRPISGSALRRVRRRLPPTIKFSELRNYPLVLAGHPNRVRGNFEAIARRLDFPLTVVADTDSIATQMRICENCGCYMIVVPPTFSEDGTGKGYSTSLIVRPMLQRYVELITTHHHPLSRAARIRRQARSKILTELAKRHKPCSPTADFPARRLETKPPFHTVAPRKSEFKSRLFKRLSGAFHERSPQHQVLSICFLGLTTNMMMRGFDPMLPQIASEMGVDIVVAAGLGTAFALPYALLQPFFGSLADIFGQARLNPVSSMLLLASVLMGAFAQSFPMLVASRVLTGIAAGGIMPSASRCSAKSPALSADRSNSRVSSAGR